MMNSFLLQKSRRMCAAVLSGLLLAAAPGFAQLRIIIDTLDATQFPQIRAKVRVLQGNATVRGLTVGNFTVQEDNVIQAPIAGYCEDTIQAAPVSALLIIDRSGSMGPSYDNAIVDAKRAAKAFVDRLSPIDECALISFHNSVGYDHPWSNNKTSIKTAIDDLMIGGGTALWDAVGKGAAFILPRTKRKAMIVLTDGDDNQSWQYTYQTALNAVRNANVVVYTIGLGSQLTAQPLRNIAAATGGKYYEAKVGADLDEIYALISQEISSTGVCELRYTSKLDCLDGTRHTVRITVSVGGDNESADAEFTLPYNPTTFSYVTLSMATDLFVEQGDSITIPVMLSQVSANRPPRSFQFNIDYDRSLVYLDSVTTGPLTQGYSVTHGQTPGGSAITLNGTAPIAMTGLLLHCHFHAAPMERSVKARISVSPPEVQQFCTHASSEDGLLTISGSCERAVTRQLTAAGRQAQLLPNVPNPFNPTTRVRYLVGTPERVTLTLFDAVGREIRALVREEQKAGEYEVMLDGSALANGAYYLHLLVGSETDVRPVVLLK